MLLQTLNLQNFRNYPKAAFTFSPHTTVIVGANAMGKTNIIESIYLLATGKSFRAEKEKQLIQFGEKVCRVTGILGLDAGPVELLSRPKSSHSLRTLAGRPSPLATHLDSDEQEKLELLLSDTPGTLLKKKYLVNGIAKRRVDFAGRLTAVLFTPTDIDIVSGQPSIRRRFLDEVLEQVDYDYRVAHTIYSKALRQRNALLDQVQESGVRNDKLFAYWDQLLITNGQKLSQKREALIGYINRLEKTLFPFTLIYDHSLISEERLAQYKQAEVGAGVTLVGPHRDDIIIQAYHPVSKELEDVKYFSSRGQQRLVVCELKLAQISYIKNHSDNKPLLLLDDIFSELDSVNIQHVLQMTRDAQTVITTTHKEFVADMGENVIELNK